MMWRTLRCWMAGVVALAMAGCSGQTMLNRMAPDDGYKVVYDQVFDASTNLKLDIYSPNDARNAPTVVFFYGGRWSEGDKADYKFVGQALASRGFVAVLANYRHYPQVKFPAFVEDGARAVAWTRRNIDQFGGSRDRLFVMGHSSGAHIAAMLALNEEYLKAVGGSRTWLRGMIGLAGPYDFMPITAPDLRDMFGPVDRFAYSQPVFFVDGKNAPLLLIHGENDTVVEVKNTRSLARAVAKAGGPVETLIYPNLSHTMIIGALGSFLRGRADVLDQIEAYINKRADGGPVLPASEIRGVPLDPNEGVHTQALPEALPAPEPVDGVSQGFQLVPPKPASETPPLFELPPPPSE